MVSLPLVLRSSEDMEDVFDLNVENGVRKAQAQPCCSRAISGKAETDGASD